MIDKRFLTVLAALIFITAPGSAQQIDKRVLETNYDLDLPDWGPYNRAYNGISHVADPERGSRFELSVAPGFYRRKVIIPTVRYEAGFHPWEASPGLEYFSYRYELEWKDQVYCDVAFVQMDKNSRYIRSEFVNNTDAQQTVTLELFADMVFGKKGFRANTHGLWTEAEAYDAIRMERDHPKRHLQTDNWKPGVKRDDKATNGEVVKGIGEKTDDWLEYKVEIDRDISDARIALRYKTEKGNGAKINVSGMAKATFALPATEQYAMAETNIGDVKAGTYRIRLNPTEGVAVLDGFAVLAKGQTAEFERYKQKEEPNRIESKTPNSFILKYEGADQYYGLVWDYDFYKVRNFKGQYLDQMIRNSSHNHVSTTLWGANSDKDNFQEVFMRPIEMAKESKRVVRSYVVNGTLEEVQAKLKKYGNDMKLGERNYTEHKAKVADFREFNPSGDKYRFSQSRMAATSLTNVVYPIASYGQQVKHYVPGKWWQSLYTWDAGFASLGLLEVDPSRGLDLLFTYLTAPENENAFTHHGTPLPIQFYSFLEIWNRTQDKEMLRVAYPRLKRYHDFLTGKAEGSDTDKFESGMLRTFSYFYNSGGWDDYSPQAYMHGKKLSGTTAPVVNTAHAIRTAKILSSMANELGLRRDAREYTQDVKRLSEGLQKYSWDKESGYFGYVTHDKNGKPTGILRNSNGENMNKGMGGAYPIFAGEYTDAQKERLMEHIRNPKELWTPIGFTAVDQSASYYSKEGYWNGSVWFPHQWTFWKSLLDMGETEMAMKVATTALNLWQREVDESYNCFEHFLVNTGRGAGWHQFGALSSPVLSWYGSLYRPGTLTMGMDGFVKEKNLNADKTELSCSLDFGRFVKKGKKATMLACMKQGPGYEVQLKGAELVSYKEILPGLLAIEFKHKGQTVKLGVKPAKTSL
ncbi:hypothetical protein FUAX_08890 [Fulvitalea axinellae]|uniref:Mannosylglycerate hydrolase MGH1-like glycoside hydrolase domain-containing protein n=1 Tax=Fulvitalea axinellae TaxID=1182444 RepID=A0AAU9CKK6_9BACT|nr:hypothetical protein FUAX_08890 [Fulvitalea axinellae]